MSEQNEKQNRVVTIQGLSFEVPAPYSEGHTLKANEAAVLNQTYAENIRNNFAAKIKAKAEEAGCQPADLDMTALQAELNEYVASYEFGVRSGGGGGQPAMSPEEREARKLAREAVTAAIKAKGYKLSQFTKDDINKYIDDLLASDDRFMKEAKKRIAARKKIAEEAVDLGSLSFAPVSDEGETEASEAA